MKMQDRLRQAHNVLYDAKEMIEDLRVSGESSAYMSSVLEKLDEADELLFDAVEDNMWKKEAN